MRPMHAILFGLFVGLLGLVRQDAGLLAFASGSVVLLFVHRDRRQFILVACFLAATFVPKLVFRAHVALSGLEVRGNLEHGIWHNLYLGMGFNANAHPETANPYGIVWDDTVGAEHAARAGAVFGSPEYMPAMRALFFRIVLHDPVFYLKSVMSRLMYELYLIGGLAYSVVGWLAALLIVWPAVFFTKHRLLYLIVCGVSILPPVLTYPSPQYSLGVAMGLIACPLFALGSMYVDGIEDSRRYLRAVGVRGRVPQDRGVLAGEPDTSRLEGESMSVPPVRDKRGRIAGSRLDSHGLKALVLRLYRSGWSARKIGQELFYSQQAIDKALRRWAEPLRRMGCKGIACLDCGKPTDGTIRCKLHTAVEAAKRCKRWREKQ